MPLYYATQKRIKDYVVNRVKQHKFTNAEFITEIDKAILDLSTNDNGVETAKIRESNKNQIHFFKKVKKYLENQK